MGANSGGDVTQRNIMGANGGETLRNATSWGKRWGDVTLHQGGRNDTTDNETGCDIAILGISHEDV